MICATCGTELRLPLLERFCSKVCYFESLKVPVKVVWERDERTCHLCGMEVTIEEASRDHLIPRAHGGPTTFGNVALAHKRCNSARGTKPVSEARTSKHAIKAQSPETEQPEL